MSDDNVEIVKGIFAAWERGDFSFIGWADPEIEFDLPGLMSGVTRGIEEMGHAFGEWLRAFSNFIVEVRGFRDAGDKVVVTLVFRGEGRGSGIPIDEIPGAAVLTLRNGKVVRIVGYTDPEAALDDAGISR
jgi:ketosteroid isomerase-like protein